VLLMMLVPSVTVIVEDGVNPVAATVEFAKNAAPSSVTTVAPAPSITPAGHVSTVLGTFAFTVSVTTTVAVLLADPGALMVMVPVYTFGARPVGLTVTATVLNSPISDMSPVGAMVSHVAPVTVAVAESAAPLLDTMKVLASDALGTGSPVV
jgi:hypothetical protein